MARPKPKTPEAKPVAPVPRKPKAVILPPVAHPPALPQHPSPPVAQLGPFAAMARNAIDRIGDVARAIGPFEAFITVMTVTGIVGLHYAPDPWPIVGLVVFGVTASLIARFTQRRLP